jgi:ribosomal protein S18 acetylase RimI-like enzyme
MSTVKVRPAGGRRDLDAFIGLPFRLHRGTPWVPPLIAERRDFLNRDKNPFFDQGEAEYFVAERGGDVVGRISAQTDERWTKHNGGNDGMFGFFDCERSPETAAALVEAAAGWLRGRGRERMLGPMDFTTNDECGLLVEGFELAPFVLEPWHPSYYQELIEGLGMAKAMDLLMWRLELGQLKQGNRFHDLIHQAAQASTTEHGVVIRHMRKRDLEAEVQRFMEVYNEAWDRNWGFVPVTEEEVSFQVKNLKPILDENWAMIAERNGEVVGAALTLPDINQVLRKMHGRLLPFGWLRFLAGRRKVDRVRVLALGVKPSYQHLGVAAALYIEHIEVAARVRQKWGEMGWILETNEPMNRAMEGMGGTVVKRYRLYELPLTGPPVAGSIPQTAERAAG